MFIFAEIVFLKLLLFSNLLPWQQFFKKVQNQKFSPYFCSCSVISGQNFFFFSSKMLQISYYSSARKKFHLSFSKKFYSDFQVKISHKNFSIQQKKFCFFFFERAYFSLYFIKKINFSIGFLTTSKKLFKKNFGPKSVSRIILVVVFEFKIVVFYSFFFHRTNFKRNYEHFLTILRISKCEK